MSHLTVITVLDLTAAHVLLSLSEQDVKLSAEVEPFVPQRKGGVEVSLISMSLPGEPGVNNNNNGTTNNNNGSGGGGGGVGGSGGVETTPIPSYLITCYPFVQENQPNRYCRRGIF